MTDHSAPRTVSIVLFDGFELLDVFGPVELLGMLPDRFAVELVAETPGPVASSQGTEVIATSRLDAAHAGDIVLVPGGAGTRPLAHDAAFLGRLAAFAEGAEIVASVCTGSALLAAAGLLEGYAATSNKRAFDWASGFGADVAWRRRARWVADRDRWTSSGVAAGMDMTAALIRHLHGAETASEVTWRIELETHDDPHWDPFAGPRPA